MAKSKRQAIPRMMAPEALQPWDSGMRPLQARFVGRKTAPDYLVERVSVPNPPSDSGVRQSGSREVQILPEAKSQSGEVCTRAESKANKGRHELRKCHVELIFAGKKMAKGNPKKGIEPIKPGAYLRACTAWGKPGIMIPVKDHEDAQKVSKTFCACRARGHTAESCAKRGRK